MSYIVRQASEDDALQIQHFMVKTGVNKAEPETDWASFLVAENEEKQFVAVVRLQTASKKAGLIRTLIVDSEKITTLFILEFLEAALHYAAEQGLKEIYMLAGNDAGFVQALGFSKAESNAIPKVIKEIPDVNAHLQKKRPIFVKKGKDLRKSPDVHK